MVGLADFFNAPVEAGTGARQSVGSTFSQGGGIEGLLGNPLFTGGLGLLAGALDDDVGFGQALGLGLGGAQQALGFQEQRLQNEAARQELLQRTRQQRARQEIFQRAAAPQPGQGQGFGILEASGNIDPQEEFGLFAEAFPDEAGAVLADRFTGQEEEQGDPLVTLGNGMQANFSELTPNMREAVGMGLVPGTAEFDEFIEQARAGGAMTDADRIQAESAATLARIEVSRELREERGRSTAAKNAIMNTARNIREMADLNETISNDVLTRPGVGFNEARSAAAQGRAALQTLLGLPGAKESERALSAVKRFEQLALTENIKNIETMREAIGGRVTQLEFGKGLLTGASTEQTPRNNAQTMLGQIQDLKVAAQVEGVELPEWIEDVESDLRSFVESDTSIGDEEVTPSAGETPSRRRPRGNTTDLGDGFTLEFVD